MSEWASHTDPPPSSAQLQRRRRQVPYFDWPTAKCCRATTWTTSTRGVCTTPATLALHRCYN